MAGMGDLLGKLEKPHNTIYPFGYRHKPFCTRLVMVVPKLENPANRDVVRRKVCDHCTKRVVHEFVGCMGDNEGFKQVVEEKDDE